MKYSGKKSPDTFIANLAKFTGLDKLNRRIAPRMRRGNQPDMPTITTDKLWFLRENRFLFLTRDGPIEVTLKPSFVLTGILVCMAGISAIFYYTLIASYSAIEVMREETIQTAEASIGKKREGLTTNNVMTWEEYQPSSSVGQLSPKLNRSYNQTSPNETTMGDNATDYLPMIIQGGKRITFADEDKTESSEARLERPASKKLIKDPISTPLPANNGKAPKTKVENTEDSPALTNQKSTRKALIDDDIKPEAKTILRAEILADTTQGNPPASAQLTKKTEMKTSELTTRAREYAVALLPSFIAKPNSIKPTTDSEKTVGFQTNAAIEQAPELASAANTASTASVRRVILLEH